ncbi:MAG: DegV family protein [Eggerthellaceae bacterium]|nr:DegV family protein [Eggerthellaceae bacterium]
MSAQCNLIIDSCCDLPLELVQQEGVQLIDFNYIIDDKTFKDDFYQSVTPKEFYDNIRNGATPSTSQVAPAETEAAFRNAIESGVPTVYLCFSSGLSSNYSTAYAIWSQLKAEHPEAPIYIVDLLIGSTPRRPVGAGGFASARKRAYRRRDGCLGGRSTLFRSDLVHG